MSVTDQVRATPKISLIKPNISPPDDFRPGQGGIGINGGKMEVHGQHVDLVPRAALAVSYDVPRRGRAAGMVM